MLTQQTSKKPPSRPIVHCPDRIHGQLHCHNLTHNGGSGRDCSTRTHMELVQVCKQFPWISVGYTFMMNFMEIKCIHSFLSTTWFPGSNAFTLPGWLKCCVNPLPEHYQLDISYEDVGRWWYHYHSDNDNHDDIRVRMTMIIRRPIIISLKLW